MTPGRVGRHVAGGSQPEDERVERERLDELREVLASWPTGVAILAVRDGDAVHALTVGSFMRVSLDPPLVLASLGANAAALPYLEDGTRFVVSILGADQKRLASRYADTFPVGPSPFPAEGDPRVDGCVASLVCELHEILVRGDHTLVIGRVVETSREDSEGGLAYYRRGYHALTTETRLD